MRKVNRINNNLWVKFERQFYNEYIKDRISSEFLARYLAEYLNRLISRMLFLRKDMIPDYYSEDIFQECFMNLIRVLKKCKVEETVFTESISVYVRACMRNFLIDTARKITNTKCREVELSDIEYGAVLTKRNGIDSINSEYFDNNSFRVKLSEIYKFLRLYVPDGDKVFKYILSKNYVRCIGKKNKIPFTYRKINHVKNLIKWFLITNYPECVSKAVRNKYLTKFPTLSSIKVK